MNSERRNKIQETICQACQGLINSLSTSYGPKGLDKMLIEGNKSIVTNDGATILKYYIIHPIHKILGNVSKAQDASCGDGTTSVVLLACSLLEELSKLFVHKIHPSKIVEAIEIAKNMAIKYINDIKTTIDESELVNVALTSLSSKIASKSTQMANVAIEALSIAKREDIRIVKKIGGNIDDIQLYNGFLTKCDDDIPSGKYKALLLQFCLSAPKTNMESKIVINDHSLVEKFVKEERDYLINMIKKVKKTGANLLIIQKSLMKESCSDLAKHFLNKLGIHIINKVDRKDMEYISQVINATPSSDIDLIDEPTEIEINKRDDMIQIEGHGCTVVINGCDEIIVDEAGRSFDDVLGVVGALKSDSSIVPGGGSVETGIAVLLENYTGPHLLILKSISKGFLSMAYFLARNAGINSIDIVSNLKRNITVNHNIGISLKTGTLADMINGDIVIQPAAVSRNMILLAFETVQMLIRIDDILPGIQ